MNDSLTEVNKITHVVESILNEYTSINKPVIAGGAIRDMRFNKTPKDYDLFFFMGKNLTDQTFFQVATNIVKTISIMQGIKSVTLHQAYDNSAGDFNKNHQGVIKVSYDNVDVDIIFTRHYNVLELMTYFDISINRCYMSVDDSGNFSESSNTVYYNTDVVELLNGTGYDLSYLDNPLATIPKKVGRLIKFTVMANEQNLPIGPILNEIIKKTVANADAQGKQFASNTINDLFLAGK